MTLYTLLPFVHLAEVICAHADALCVPDAWFRRIRLLADFNLNDEFDTSIARLGIELL